MSNRTTEKSDSMDNEIESYLKLNLPTQQIVSFLKTQGKDEKEIDATIEKYEESRKKIKKYIRKFVDKIERKYGDLDIPELVKKGIKFAKKHGFSPSEERAFVNHVMTGDVDTTYLPFQELAYTEMSKFLGFSTIPMMNIKATDQALLDEIAKLYEHSKGLHQSIKNTLAVYRSCAIEAITGRYDRDKHNIAAFIHPVVVALFLPRIEAIQKRMLISNIGRMIVQKSMQYLRKYSVQAMTITKTELDADFELMYDIARDPNSMNYFSDETPLANLLKRFKIQIELYKNVVALRSGKYYSNNNYDVVEDGITGLSEILKTYEWTYFDSPDLYHIQDEGTYLRKLLAVFSLRPTFTQLSSVMSTSSMGYSNFGTSKLTFVNTPIINVKLPRSNIFGASQSVPFIRLDSALSQTEHFIENKMIIPKFKTVIYSKDLVFFYANRRYHSVNFTNMDVSFRYINLPGTISNITNVNTTELHFNDSLSLGSEKFFLRSVVVLNKISKHEFATTGCSAIVVSKREPYAGAPRPNPLYWYYNPVAANLMFPDPQKPGYTSNSPIMALNSVSGVNKPGFHDLARKFGTIYVYSGKDDESNN
jgi:hypothetical protein